MHAMTASEGLLHLHLVPFVFCRNSSLVVPEKMMRIMRATL